MHKYKVQYAPDIPSLNRELHRASISINLIDDDLPTSTATTAELTAADSRINAIGKYTGKMAFNTTTTAPIWASGPDATDVWVDATGATAHTPV